MLTDLKLYLPGDLLTLADRISMRHSLEVRVPFLDHPLVEFMARKVWGYEDAGKRAAVQALIDRRRADEASRDVARDRDTDRKEVGRANRRTLFVGVAGVVATIAAAFIGRCSHGG